MSVVRVVVVRSGGFAGITRTAEVDDADSAQRLSAAVLADAGRSAEHRRRDGFVYEFTLIRGSSTERVDLQDGSVGPELRDTLQTLFS